MRWRPPLLRSSRVARVQLHGPWVRPKRARQIQTNNTVSTGNVPVVTHAQLLRNTTGHNDSAITKQEDHPKGQVKIAGLVRSARWKKNMVFAHIHDGTTYEPLQAILPTNLAEGRITNGAYVELSGKWEASPARGQSHELQVTAVENVGVSDAQENPIQKATMTPQYLRTIPHMRIRTPFQALLARTRSHVITSISQHFEGRSRPVIQVQPPLITSSDCEGAGEVFTVSAPRKTKNDSDHFFKEPKYLTVSSQLHLEAWSADLGDVWAVSPTFRAEESDTSRHLAEFYMLEAEYRSIDSVEDVMAQVESLIRTITSKLSDSNVGKELLAFYNDRKHRPFDAEEVSLADRWLKVGVASDGWPRITYTEAMHQVVSFHHANPGHFDHEPNWENGLALEHERWIVTNLGGNRPTFVTHYPQSQKPFYMLPSSASETSSSTSTSQHPSASQATVACFDLLLPDGCAEVCGGSLREHRLEHLVDAMRTKGLLKTATGAQQSDYPYLQPGESLGNLQWYADLRRFGSSPHGGFGIGFDRLLAYLTGVPNIRDIVGFPRYWGSCQC